MQEHEQWFLSKVVKTKDCWDWSGAVNKDGYGRLGRVGKQFYSHRFSYILFVGEIPSDKELDHICRNRKCVNPEHLRLASRQENIENRVIVLNKLCKRGHLLDRISGRSRCKECAKLHTQKFRAK